MWRIRSVAEAEQLSLVLQSQALQAAFVSVMPSKING